MFIILYKKSKDKFKYLVISLSIIFFLSHSLIVKAQNCEEISCNEDSDEYRQCLENKKSCLEKKLVEISKEKTTLNNTISVFNGSINIQEVKINQTVAEINKLEKEYFLKKYPEVEQKLNFVKQKQLEIEVQGSGEGWSNFFSYNLYDIGLSNIFTDEFLKKHLLFKY